MRKLTKGFTLIEMLVVIAIISILAGIVLTGVSGFQAGARDSKRVADLQVTRNYLESYFTRYGFYPGGDSSGVQDATVIPTDWAALKLTLDSTLGVTTPTERLPSRTYRYWVDTDNDENLRYILGAYLERDNAVLSTDVEAEPATGTWEGDSSADIDTACVDAIGANQYGYCIAS